MKILELKHLKFQLLQKAQKLLSIVCFLILLGGFE